MPLTSSMLVACLALQNNPPGKCAFIEPNERAIQDVTEPVFDTCWAVEFNKQYVAVGLLEIPTQNGIVHLYRQDEGHWRVDATLRPEVKGVGTFGMSVEFIKSQVAVGAPFQRGSSEAGSDVVYLFAQENADWKLTATLRGADTETEDMFGWSLSASGDWLAVGAPNADGAAEGQGAVYLFHEEQGEYVERAKLTLEDGNTNDHFGWSVSLEGSNLVVGAPHRSVDVNHCGEAYVFTCNDLDWMLSSTLAPTDATFGSLYGEDVAISGDWIFVGAPRILTEPEVPGSVFVYRTTPVFKHEATLTAPDACFGCPDSWYQRNEGFGYRLAASKDVLVASATFSKSSAGRPGLAYLYRFNDSWEAVGKLSPTGVDERLMWPVATDGANVFGLATTPALKYVSLLRWNISDAIRNHSSP